MLAVVDLSHKHGKLSDVYSLARVQASYPENKSAIP
jgi:hypothetical protein